MKQYLTILLILVAIFCLGMWGQLRLDPDQGFANSVYQVMMLFGLEGDWTSQYDLPWQLQITRFVAPLATISSVLFVLTRDAWIESINYFIRFRQEHVIVAGLGEKAWQFIKSAQHQYRLVVVEIDEDNHLIPQARKAGISVITGDVLAEGMWQKTNLERARHLVAFTGNDGTNVELAIKARNYLRTQPGESRHQLRIHMHIGDTLAQRLEGYPKFFGDSALAEINFFSADELIARMVLERYPPEIFADVFGQTQVHFALYNFSQLAEHILLQAIRTCHFANGSRVRFSIFDEQARDKESHFRNAYPEIDALCDVTFLQSSVPLQSQQAVLEIPESLLQNFTAHIVCFPTDSESLELALVLREALLNHRGANAPILVRMQQSSGLAQLLESNVGSPEIPDGLYPFGMFDEVLHHENILSDRLDQLARVIHLDYLNRRGSVTSDQRLYAALSDWHALPVPERQSNRLQADHLHIKLRAIRCTRSDHANQQFDISHEEAAQLAQMEHERWRANKMFEGWRGGAVRIEGAKVNPYIKDWGELVEEERESQIDTIKHYPDMLFSHLGWGIQRDFIIGITGHRLNKLDITNTRLQASVRDCLKQFQSQHPNRRFIIMSPLAEGADRLVAKMAMEEFDMTLWVPLPLPYELYETDFTDSDSLEEFKSLVGKAELYFELPMKFGTREELAARQDGSTKEQRNQQYALAGAYLVKTCDELIGIYDGQPEEGVGGTGQVIRWRREDKIDLPFVNKSDFFSHPDCSTPVILEPNP